MPNVLRPVHRPLSLYRYSRLYRTKPAGWGGSRPPEIATANPQKDFIDHPLKDRRRPRREEASQPHSPSPAGTAG